MKPRRKSKRIVEVYQKYSPPPFRTMKALPTATAVILMHSERTHQYPSATSRGEFVAARTSVMEPMNLAKESPEVREAIIEKSRRIAPAFNKAAYQYVTDDTEPKYIGKKI